jgi:ketosteroid isomerase-like protein
MRRQNIEVVLGFLDAIRRRDREAAAGFLHREIVWTGVVPDLVCRTPGEVLDIFLGRRDEQIEVDRLELIGAEQGAVFAFHRPEIWEVAGIEIRGSMYHAAEVVDGRITRINDYADRPEALAAAELGDQLT